MPSELMDICFRFFYEICLKELAYTMTDEWDNWDPNSTHPAISIDNKNNKLILRSSAGSNPYIFGTNRTSSGVSIWRFKIHKRHAYFIGVIIPKHIKWNTQGAEHTEKGDAHILYQDARTFPLEDPCAASGVNFERTGDVICMILDTNEKQILYSVNEQDLVCVFDGIDTSKEFVLTVSIEGGAHFELMASTHFSS
eukprot:562687_1